MLPNVKIFFENGALRSSVPMPDGVGGAVLTGVAVAGTFALNTPYVLRNIDGLKTLGITEANNPTVYKFVREFYAEAASDVECWIMAVPDTVKLSEMADMATDNAKKLINAAQGRLRWVAFSRLPGVGYTPTITAGLDADVAAAKTKAQELCEYFTNSKYAPLFAIIEGAGFSGNATELADNRTGTFNRVGVLIGDTVTSDNATIGTLMGRIAVSQVQRSIARVKDGAVAPVSLFIGDKPVEQADVETIDSKGYITFRTFVDRAGYFFNNDFLSAPDVDDYSLIPRRRTVDKAYRIAYQTLLNELNDEVPINADGTLPESFVKSWQAMVEGDIARQMTANGELSGDVANGDKGVVCYIDPTQNVVSTSKIIVQIRIRPFGYAKFIEVRLGFTAIAG